jgi:predicted P-loop ATPase/GTPase
MLFEYLDKFLINGVTEEELEVIEGQKYKEVTEKLGITDPFWAEKLTKVLVYMEIAKINLEAEGMKEKYEIYKEEFEKSLQQISFTIPVMRG